MTNLVQYKNWAVDGSGDIVAAAAIEVHRNADAGAATLYTSASGAATKTNPFNAEADGSFEFWVTPDRYDILVGAGASQTTTPFDPIAGLVSGPEQFGAILDGSTNDATEIGAWFDYLAANPHGLGKISGTTDHPATLDPVPVHLIATDDGAMHTFSGHTNAHMRGGHVKLSGTGNGWATLIDGANDGLIIEDALFESSSFTITSKPGTNGDPDAITENLIIRNNTLIGIEDTTDGGIKLDGNTRGALVTGNLIRDMHRSDASRVAHAMGAAGAAGEALSNHDTHTALYNGNLIHNITGAAMHGEDATFNISFSFNAVTEAEIGLDLVNTNNPRQWLVMGNMLTGCVSYFLFATGTSGTVNDSFFAFNMLDGFGVTNDEDYSVRIGGPDTSGFHYIGNSHNDLTNLAARINIDGMFWLDHNNFRDITEECFEVQRDEATCVVANNNFGGGTYGLTGAAALSLTAVTDKRGVWIESTNSFAGVTTAVVEKTSSASFVGDQRMKIANLTANAASDEVVLIAQRDGWITGVMRSYLSAGAGSSAGNFTVVRSNTSGSTTLLAKTISHTGTQFDGTLWSSKNTDLTNAFSRGDVIRVVCAGDGDGATMAAVQIDFFYYD